MKISHVGAALVLAKPWTVVEEPHLRVDTELLEFVCLEKERDLAHMVGR